MSFRRSGIFVIGVASIAVAAGILWTFVRPERVSMLGTPMLLASFGLVLLPALVYLGCWLDRSRSSAPSESAPTLHGPRNPVTHASRAAHHRRARESTDLNV
jgi:hypothetical protein